MKTKTKWVTHLTSEVISDDYKPSNETIGFVYQIREISSNRVYYGIKKFWKRIRRKPLKGKKRHRIDYVESDWRYYKTSSPLLQLKLTENPDNYVCSIIRTCDSVADMKAYEAYLQLTHYFEKDPSTMFNEVVNLRLRLRK